jgi:hypothetical protein
MKVKYKQTGQIYDMPDGQQIDTNLFEPVDNVQAQPTIPTTNETDGMKTLYQNMFTQATTIKDKNAVADSYKGATGKNLFEVTEATVNETAAEKAAKMKKGELENVMNLLEDKYTTKKLAKGRLGGLLASILAVTGYNPDVTDYQTLRESIKPQLVKAAGDTGALSLVEQQAAIQSIPTVYSTPEEAVRQFATTRQKFGLQPIKPKVKLEDIFK